MKGRKSWSLYGAFVVGFLGMFGWNASRTAHSSAWQVEQQRLEYARNALLAEARSAPKYTKYFLDRRGHVVLCVNCADPG